MHTEVGNISSTFTVLIRMSSRCLAIFNWFISHLLNKIDINSLFKQFFFNQHEKKKEGREKRPESLVTNIRGTVKKSPVFWCRTDSRDFRMRSLECLYTMYIPEFPLIFPSLNHFYHAIRTRFKTFHKMKIIFISKILIFDMHTLYMYIMLQQLQCSISLVSCSLLPHTKTYTIVRWIWRLSKLEQDTFLNLKIATGMSLSNKFLNWKIHCTLQLQHAYLLSNQAMRVFFFLRFKIWISFIKSNNAVLFRSIFSAKTISCGNIDFVWSTLVAVQSVLQCSLQ